MPLPSIVNASSASLLKNSSSHHCEALACCAANAAFCGLSCPIWLPSCLIRFLSTTVINPPFRLAPNASFRLTPRYGENSFARDTILLTDKISGSSSSSSSSSLPFLEALLTVVVDWAAVMSMAVLLLPPSPSIFTPITSSSATPSNRNPRSRPHASRMLLYTARNTAKFTFAMSITGGLRKLYGTFPFSMSTFRTSSL